MEHATRSAPPSASLPAGCCAGWRTAGRRAPRCNTASASTIPASSFPAGRCTAIGAATASRSGTTANCWPRTTTPTTRRPTTPPASAQLLAERLQVDPGLVSPAYEDIHYYLWRENRLPANVIAEDAKLQDPLERARLAKVFGQGLAASVGSVLPLRRVARDGARRWQSGKLVPPLRRAVPGPRRQPDRLPPAAGEPALGRPAGLRTRPILRTVHGAADAAFSASRGRLPAEARQVQSASGLPARPRRSAGPVDYGGILRSRSCRRTLPVSRPRRARAGPHRADRGAARRPDARVLPAAVRGRGLARSGRGRRGDRGRDGPQGGPGRLPAAARSAPAALLRHARSGRDRGQHPSRHATGPSRSSAPRSCTRKRASSASAPRSSCWTAGMSAPAAATTW